VKLDSYQTYGTVWATGTWGLQVAGYDGGTVTTWIQDPNVEGLGSATSTEQLSLNEWHHITSTFDNGTLSLYIDGELWASEMADSAVLPTPTTNPRGLDIDVFYLGKEMPDIHMSAMDGQVDGLRISNVVRYSGNFTPEADPKTDKNTILLWNFIEGQDSTVKDESGNGYHGSLMNAQWSTESDCDVD
jgi:hypothetical protein